MPRFSVIIPVYNKEKQLSNTIESVIKQRFEDFELIVVNDGATDTSETIIKSLQIQEYTTLNKKTREFL